MKASLSAHARAMLLERGIEPEWVDRAMERGEAKPEPDGTVHHLFPIMERAGRVLRVVVNPSAEPPVIVTVFFDRRLGRQAGAGAQA